MYEWILLLLTCTSIKLKIFLKKCVCNNIKGGGVMVIVAGCGLGDTSSNPGRDWLHFINVKVHSLNVKLFYLTHR